MQNRNFFVHLRFIFTVFKHKYNLKLNIHLECVAMRNDLLRKKTKVSSFILPEILVKNTGINNNTP